MTLSTRPRRESPKTFWFSEWLYDRIYERLFPDENLSEGIRRLLYYAQLNEPALDSFVSVIPWQDGVPVQLRIEKELLNWIDSKRGRSRQKKLNRLLTSIIYELPLLEPVIYSIDLLPHIKDVISDKPEILIKELLNELKFYASRPELIRMLLELEEQGHVEMWLEPIKTREDSSALALGEGIILSKIKLLKQSSYTLRF